VKLSERQRRDGLHAAAPPLVAHEQQNELPAGGRRRRAALRFPVSLDALCAAIRQPLRPLAQGQALHAAGRAPARAHRRALSTVASAAPKRRVVVTGLGCVTSLGHDKHTFYKRAPPPPPPPPLTRAPQQPAGGKVGHLTDRALGPGQV